MLEKESKASIWLEPSIWMDGGLGMTISVGDVVWEFKGSKRTDVGIALGFIQARPGDEAHIRVQCTNGDKRIWDATSSGSAGSPQPYEGKVVIKWLEGRPLESDEHEEWQGEMLAPLRNRAVMTTDPWGQKHWLILPREAGQQTIYSFEGGGGWRRIVAQTLS